MWQAEADIELTLSASPTTAVSQKALFQGTFSKGPCDSNVVKLRISEVYCLIKLLSNFSFKARSKYQRKRTVTP